MLSSPRPLAALLVLAVATGTAAAGPTRADVEAAALAALPQAVAQVRELVRLESVTAPGVDRQAEKTAVLEAVVLHAQALGLSARLLPGDAVAVVELDGPEPAFGILTHADVVPAGDPARWRHPPFAAELADGAIWGRGTADDKGPTIAVLHAMAIARDLAPGPLRRKVRFIVGSSEENMDWRDLDAVVAAGLVPPEGFAADAGFPVIHAEKSFLDARVRFARDRADPVLESFAGGVVPNAVPESATATLRVPDAPAALERVERAAVLHRQAHPEVRFEAGADGKVLVLRARGRAAHGSQPAAGVNAAAHLGALLYRLMGPLGVEADSAEGRALRFLGERLALELDGASLGLARSHPVLGETTVNLGVVDTGPEGVDLALNVRLPVGLDLRRQQALLREALAPYGGRLVDATGMEALWVAPDSPLVQRLLGVYRNMTGHVAAQPQAIGGTTYAKAFAGFVAFGMAFPDGPMVAHAQDERLRVEDLSRGIAVYAAALLDLAAGAPMAGATAARRD